MEIPKKKEVFKPTSEQVGNGAYYDLNRIDGFNECHDQFTQAIVERLKEYENNERPFNFKDLIQELTTKE